MKDYKRKYVVLLICIAIIISIFIVGYLIFHKQKEEDNSINSNVANDFISNNTENQYNVSNKSDSTYKINWDNSYDKFMLRRTQAGLGSLEISSLQLNKVTLESFINKLNSSETNYIKYSPTVEDTGFDGVPYISNEEFVEIMEKFIPKGTTSKISYSVELEGALPRFKIEFLIVHPNYLDIDNPNSKEFVMDEDTYVRNWVIKGIRFYGSKVDSVDVADVENNPSNHCKLDVLNSANLLTKYKGKTEDEIAQNYINSLEEAMEMVYAGYHFSDEMKEKLQVGMKYILFEIKQDGEVPDSFYWHADDLNVVYYAGAMITIQ